MALKAEYNLISTRFTSRTRILLEYRVLCRVDPTTVLLTPRCTDLSLQQEVDSRLLDKAILFLVLILYTAYCSRISGLLTLLIAVEFLVYFQLLYHSSRVFGFSFVIEVNCA